MGQITIIIIITELAKEFEGQFECLGENTKKYKTFSILIEKKVTKIDKDVMMSSLWNLADNLAEGIHKIKCKDFCFILECESVNENNKVKIFILQWNLFTQD